MPAPPETHLRSIERRAQGLLAQVAGIGQPGFRATDRQPLFKSLLLFAPGPRQNQCSRSNQAACSRLAREPTSRRWRWQPSAQKILFSWQLQLLGH